MLNTQKGNMYPWLTHTWNVIKGKCPHDCNYCYMKQYPQSDLRFDSEEFKTDLGTGNTIFVGSSCDMFAADIHYSWIAPILDQCRDFNNNNYLYQTKHPFRFFDFLDDLLFPSKIILCSTIESDIIHKQISKAPDVITRYLAMKKLTTRKIISIEPIMDFNTSVLIKWMKEIDPEFVSIGADSKGHNLPEPSSKKIHELFIALSEFTEVKLKSNLKRLYHNN